LLARQAARGPKVAFWGHGGNLQADASALSRISEAAKARYSRLPHWWFAYTEGSARRVEALGFPADRITVVQNAVDTSLIEATTAERDPLRAIYVGGLYEAKRLDLLFAAADLVAAAVPGFSLAVVGDGELRGYVQSAAASRPYVEYFGATFGKDLAVELKSSSVMLMPGAVGLGVLDAFAAGLPVITTAGAGHGPEFEYLEHGVNSIITERTAAALAEGVQIIICGTRRVEGHVGSAARFSVSDMASRFASGLTSSVEQLRV
jgi:glycosyltransferase involved in cell wall biosynthesis